MLSTNNVQGNTGNKHISLGKKKKIREAPLSTGFPRQEYWSGLPFPSPGIFPTY